MFTFDPVKHGARNQYHLQYIKINKLTIRYKCKIHVKNTVHNMNH